MFIGSSVASAPAAGAGAPEASVLAATLAYNSTRSDINNVRPTLCKIGIIIIVVYQVSDLHVSTKRSLS